MITKFILVMGVSGCGKTTVGMELATRLGWKFYDGDTYHSPDNIAKMRAGVALGDDDRLPWLQGLHKIISMGVKESKPGVIACSALKEGYRQILLKDCDNVLVVYLKGGYELIWSRMAHRSDHYMKPEMLKGQFDILEEPVGALVIDVSLPIDEIVQIIISAL